MSEFYIRKTNTTCSICGKAIYRRPGVLEHHGGRAYCSSHCYGISMRKETPCTVCGTLILAGANKQTCSRTCANKNRAGMQYLGRKPLDKVRSQRMLKKRLMNDRGKACERCTYEIYQVLQVHHKNRDRSNNELNNLELLCPNCHAKEHYLKN